MEIQTETYGSTEIAVVQGHDRVIESLEDAMDLLGNASYLGTTAILARDVHFSPDFF